MRNEKKSASKLSRIFIYLKNKINFVEHHLAHLAAAYYSCPTYEIGRKFLGLTCDGAGDGLAGSVSLCENNNINRIAEIDRHASLGKLYSRTTMLMGMRPWEHEFRIDGLGTICRPRTCSNCCRYLPKYSWSIDKRSHL